MSTLSNKEIHLLVELLDRCQPGRLLPEVFEAVGRIIVSPAVEFIPLRKKGNHIEVLLLKRPSDDIIWPSMLHTPGTVLRPSDKSFEDAFKRLLEDELVGIKTDLPVFMGAHISSNKRGRCLLLEHLVVVNEEPVAGTFYRIDDLPDKFIADQKASLDRAVVFYNNLQHL